MSCAYERLIYTADAISAYCTGLVIFERGCEGRDTGGY